MLPKSFLYFLEMNWFNILQNVVCTPLVILNLIFRGKTLTSMAGIHQHQPFLVWECVFSSPHCGAPPCPGGALPSPQQPPSPIGSHLDSPLTSFLLPLQGSSPGPGSPSHASFHLFPRLTFCLNFHFQPPHFPILPSSWFLWAPGTLLI